LESIRRTVTNGHGLERLLALTKASEPRGAQGAG